MSASSAPASASLTVGWIGLGAMGAPMARVTAQAGHAVTAFDMNPASVQSVAPDVEAAASAQDAARGADVVVIMVATGPQLMSVLFGEHGIAEVLTPSTTVMVMATVGPAEIDEATSQLAPFTTRVVDAPVSGGVARAGAGDLLVMVSGADEDVTTVRPLLDAMASSAPVVGAAVGDGQRFKVVNQLLCGVHIAAAGEALALADSMGLDIAQVYEVLGAGAAQSFMFGDRGARMVAGDFTDVRSALDIFVKDMGLVNSAARAVEQQVPLAKAAAALYQRGHDEGAGRLDDSVVYQLLGGGTRSAD